MHLPGKITYKEIDEMIATVDKNEDWKISYSEFRVRNITFQKKKNVVRDAREAFNQNKKIRGVSRRPSVQ